MDSNRADGRFEELGERVATYQIGKSGLKSPATWLVTASWIVLITAVATYGLQRGYYGFTRFGLVAAAAWGAPWLAAGLILILPLAIWLLYRARIPKKEISIHQHGLHAVIGRRKELSIPWLDLEGILYEGVQTVLLLLPLPTNHKLSLLPADGPRLDLKSRYKAAELLVDDIKKSYYPIKLPEYRRTLDSGRPVSFGLLVLDSGGIQAGKDRISLREIDGIQVGRGILTVRFGSRKQIKLPVFSIPDLELLLTLIEERSS